MAEELIKNVAKSEVFHLADLVQGEEGQVVSLTLSQTPKCKMTVFAIDADEGMASHAARATRSSRCSRERARSRSRARRTSSRRASPS